MPICNTMDEICVDTADEAFPIRGFKDSNSYTQTALRSILTAVKAANALPSAGDDFDFYSTFEGFRTVMQLKGQSILSLMTSLVRNQNIRESFEGRELEENFDLLESVNEIITENISSYIDEASGLKKSEEELILAVKPQSAINTSWNKKQFNVTSQSYKLLAAKNISRPQLSFRDKIDNSNLPFVPIIREKPNSIKPLAVVLERDAAHTEEFCHPYEWEIERFDVSDDILQEVEPTMPKPLEQTPYVLVNTVEQLTDLLEDLRQQKEFAVDLEHHSYRSFQGFTCLMQISTREKDYVIDVIELRSEVHVLNEVFTDPKIVKVLHGADMDVLWLQRDFGVYVVNMFDTGQAARVLHFAHLSLSYLLKHYCKLDLDKQFQLADWRIRPLPNEMILYARQDTHYLLYVYDCLKNDLLKSGNQTQNLLRSTFERSKIICLKKYQKPYFSEDKYIELYKKTKKILNAKQLYCLKELYSWRDKIARENDESLAYVLPNHMLLQIAEALPREQQGILACCNPVPPLVKQQLNELHSIVLKANESSIKQLAILELERKAQANSVKNQMDMTSDLTRCPHDILHAEEKKNLFNSSNAALPLITKEEVPVTHLRKEPAVTALFENPRKTEKVHSSFKKVSDILSKLYSPYQRYEMTEQLQMNAEEKNSTAVNNSTQETSSMNPGEVDCVVEEADSCIITSDYSVRDTSVEFTTPNTPVETSTPLRKKKNKKRRRGAEPDVPFATPIHSGPPPPKKSKTPEVVVLDDFEPHDYSKVDFNAFSGKKQSKGGFKPEMQHNFKGPGKHLGQNNKRHFKQGTFSNSKRQERKNWPQNK